VAVDFAELLSQIEKRPGELLDVQRILVDSGKRTSPDACS
jgi:hypothetical protein